jgi:hypothetical protein
VKRPALFLGCLVACAVAVGQVPGVPSVTRIDVDPTSDTDGGGGRSVDSSMSCGDLQREVRTLERVIQARQQAIEDALNVASATAAEIDRSPAISAASGAGIQAAASILPRPPGVGPLGGLAVGIASDAASAASQGSTSSRTGLAQSSVQKAMDAQQALYFEEARHQQLVSLFLDKKCVLD